MPSNNKKGNINSTTKAEIIYPLPFVTLSLTKHYRHITKHFTNLSYTVPQSHYQVLAFLAYIIKPDNSFIYDTHLHKQFITARKHAAEHYGNNMDPNTIIFIQRPNKIKPLSAPTFRKIIKSFISSAIIIPINKQLLLLNPMLSYHSSVYDTSAFKRFQEQYNSSSKDLNTHIRTVCTKYYINTLTDSRPFSNQSKKAKLIRAGMPNTPIQYTQQIKPCAPSVNNNTVNNANNKQIFSFTTFQNIPTLD